MTAHRPALQSQSKGSEGLSAMSTPSPEETAIKRAVNGEATVITPEIAQTLCTGAGPNIASAFESTGRCGDTRDIKIMLVLGGKIKIL